MNTSDETDPLALIVAALRAATDAANEAVVAAKAARRATAETKNAIDDPADGLVKKVNAIGKALNNMTISREALKQGQK